MRLAQEAQVIPLICSSRSFMDGVEPFGSVAGPTGSSSRTGRSWLVVVGPVAVSGHGVQGDFRGRPGGQREGRRTNHALVLEVQVEVVGPRARHRSEEPDVGSGLRRAVAG